MPDVDLIPADPTHQPFAEARGLLYPMYALRLRIRAHPRAEPRTLWFSVDGMRGIPLPIRGRPETTEQAVPAEHRLLAPIAAPVAVRTTRHFAKKGLGFAGGLLARIDVDETHLVYKLYWIDDRAEPGVLVDSRSGKRIPMADPDPATRFPATR